MQIKFLFILACTAAFVMTSCDSKKETASSAQPATPVTAQRPEVRDITLYLESIGELRPSVFMEIFPRTNGTLTDVFASEGQQVQQGDPLFQIDPKPYEIRLREAKAQLNMDKASYKAVQKKLERFKDLAQKDIVAQTEWDELEAQAEKAKGLINLDQARLDAAKLDLEHCTLTSPINGRIGKLDAHPGLLVAAGQQAPLAAISKMDPLIVEFTITEKEFAQLPKGELKIELSALCSKDDCKQAHVTFLDNQFDPKTGLLLIRGRVENGEVALRPGQSVRIRLPVAVETQAKIIPQRAVRYNQSGPYVYIVQEDATVAMRQLILGTELGADQIVKEGVDENEQVVLDGHLRLFPGTKVEVKS